MSIDLLWATKASKKLPRDVNGAIASMNTADRNSQGQQETGCNSRLLSASVPAQTRGDCYKPERDVSRNRLPDRRKKPGEEMQDGPLPAAVCVGDEEISKYECVKRSDSVEFCSVIDGSDQKNERKRDMADDGKCAPPVGDSIETLVMKAGINGILVMKVWSRASSLVIVSL